MDNADVLCRHQPNPNPNLKTRLRYNRSLNKLSVPLRAIQKRVEVESLCYGL